MSGQEFNPTRGRVKRSVLFHTLEEGVVTASTLCTATGLSIASAQSALFRLREWGLMRWADKSVTPTTDHRFSGHALTAKGIEAAMQIDKSEVIFATAKTAKATETVEMECH